LDLPGGNRFYDAEFLLVYIGGFGSYEHEYFGVVKFRISQSGGCGSLQKAQFALSAMSGEKRDVVLWWPSMDVSEPSVCNPWECHIPPTFVFFILFK
jgi:hypothetical protein